MAMNLEVFNHIPTSVKENAVQAWNVLDATHVPEIGEMCDNAAKLAEITADEVPKYIGALVKSDIANAEELCNCGRAVEALVGEVGRVSGRVTMAVAIGGVALAGCYYLYTKYKNQEARTRALEQKVYGG